MYMNKKTLTLTI